MIQKVERRGRPKKVQSKIEFDSSTIKIVRGSDLNKLQGGLRN